MSDIEDEAVSQLREEVDRLAVMVKEQDEKLKKQDNDIKASFSIKLVVMLNSRRVDRFRNRQTSSSDLSISEWFSYVRTQAASRKLNKADFADFLVHNLAGKARQEILGRGDSINKDPVEIIKKLSTKEDGEPTRKGQRFKPLSPVVERHTTGTFNKGSCLSETVEVCPEANVDVNGIKMCCLLDIGAQVSTMTDSFYRSHITDFGDLVDKTDMLRISAANGGDIPYLGYIECNLQALGYTFENMGFLEVKDSIENTLKQRKNESPL
ncbi:unnamed protein product [Mytilus coruscus]|uniref:Uncharacterized protein n=1 Tax=Mytilus coruscus TaxID=42192 RepID=A0A6J8CNS1_MYTCO|nr:unnamed protein product [Mytilus coruscus]